MKEKDYLLNLVSVNEVKENKLYICEEGSERKYIVGYLSPNKEKNHTSKIVILEDWIRNFNLVVGGAKASFKDAIDKVYNTDALKMFSLITPTVREEEKRVYYDLENGLFRLGSLWDCFAQFVNVAYDLNLDIKKVDVNKVFSKKNTDPQFSEITQHFGELDNTENDPWSGNYSYYKDLRNSMIHRYSIMNSVFSNQGMTIKDHPSYILKRLCEELSFIVVKFKEFVDLVRAEVIKDCEK